MKRFAALREAIANFNDYFDAHFALGKELFREGIGRRGTGGTGTRATDQRPPGRGLPYVRSDHVKARQVRGRRIRLSRSRSIERQQPGRALLSRTDSDRARASK